MNISVKILQDLSLDPSLAVAAAPPPHKDPKASSLFELGESVEIRYQEEVEIPSKTTL